MDHDCRPLDSQRCFRELKDGVRHLHKFGIAHCDIHEGNIMLDADDTAVIIDSDHGCKEGDGDANGLTHSWTTMMGIDYSRLHSMRNRVNKAMGLKSISYEGMEREMGAYNQAAHHHARLRKTLWTK